MICFLSIHCEAPEGLFEKRHPPKKSDPPGLMIGDRWLMVDDERLSWIGNYYTPAGDVNIFQGVPDDMGKSPQAALPFIPRHGDDPLGRSHSPG